MNVQILIPQILTLQHSNHINSHVWWICTFVLTKAVFSGCLSTISHTNSGRLISGTEMSAYGDLTTFSSGVGKLRPLSLLTDATGRREATAPYVCLITLQPSHKLLQLFIVLACRTYKFAAVRCFRIYCTVYQSILHNFSEHTLWILCINLWLCKYCAVCQNILCSLSENIAHFIRTYCTVYKNILHSLSEHTEKFVRKYCGVCQKYCTVYQNILRSLSEHTAILLEYTAHFIRTYCTVYQNILHSLSENTAQFVRTNCVVFQNILYS
jgi:hypothetical protein